MALIHRPLHGVQVHTASAWLEARLQVLPPALAQAGCKCRQAAGLQALSCGCSLLYFSCCTCTTCTVVFL